MHRCTKPFVIALILCAGTGAVAQTLWEHNGSTVRLDASGPSRQFIYEQPRAGLPVGQGTTLFSGRKSGNTYAGTAYVFSERCGAIPYRVTGSIENDQRTVVMRGQAPRLGASCKVVGHRADVLVFNFIEGSGRAETLTLGVNARGFHDNPCGSKQPNLTVYAPSVAVREDFDTMASLDRRGDFELRESNLIGNACALIFEGRRYIVLGNYVGGRKEDGDVDEIRGVDIVVLAHEIGHHACGHLTSWSGYTDNPQQNWKIELEADQHAGMLLGKMFRAGKLTGWNDSPEEFMGVIVDGMIHGRESSASVTHPPREMRIEAVRRGFYSERGC